MTISKQNFLKDCKLVKVMTRCLSILVPEITYSLGGEAKNSHLKIVYNKGNISTHKLSKRKLNYHKEHIVSILETDAMKFKKVASEGRIESVVKHYSEYRILIIDEILSVGDIKFRKKSSEKIRSMMKDGVTVLEGSEKTVQLANTFPKTLTVGDSKVPALIVLSTVADMLPIRLPSASMTPIPTEPSASECDLFIRLNAMLTSAMPSTNSQVCSGGLAGGISPS